MIDISNFTDTSVEFPVHNAIHVFSCKHNSRVQLISAATDGAAVKH